MIARQSTAVGNRRKSFAADGASFPVLPNSAAARGLRVLEAEADRSPRGAAMRRHGFLIDMDGVIYRGKQLISGADLFISSLIDRGIPFAFLTNNSQRTRRDVARKLARMGIFVEESHIFTCAMATARFLAAQKPGGTAFVIGEGGLLAALHKNGYAIV